MTEISDISSEDMWTPYKELLSTVEYKLTTEGRVASHTEFELVLRKHKQNFFNILSNPPKNAKAREELKKGMTEGITLRGLGHQMLTRELYQEVVIISDMYNLNEYMALDLLCTAQVQLANYPGLTRGLVAVLLYYDGRRSIVMTLNLLMKARKGVLWRMDIADSLSAYVTEFLDDILNSGLFNRILDLLNNLDLSKEIELLQQNRALGGPKHSRQIIDLFQDIRKKLAEIIYLWSAQSGLSRTNFLTLLNHMRVLNPQEDATGGIDDVTFILQMAVLYALDLSCLHTREDGEEIVRSLPLLSNSELVESLVSELSLEKGKWDCEGLQALTMFAFAVCLASMRLVPQNEQLQALIEQEDIFINTAIDLKVFEFLINVFMKNDLLHETEYLYRRMHYLITDFIVLMHPKIKELRLRADETARTIQVYLQEGLEAPSNLPRHFENLMLTIAKLYSKDPTNQNFMVEFWCPSDIPTHSFTYRQPPRPVSLFKFVRLAGDVVPPSMFVPYLTMLSSLASCKEGAHFCFNMLKQNGPVNISTVSWDHFFNSFTRYYNNLRQETLPVNDTVYRHRNYPKGITPQEIQGLQAVLALIRAVADYDNFSRVALCEHPGWAPLNILLGLVGCSVPVPLKADLLRTLASLSKSAETAAQMWNNLEASQILVTIPNTSSYQPRGIQTELDEIESRMEEFPLTRALLELLDVLTDSGIPRTLGAGPRKPGFDPYLTFIIDSVFLKFHSRSYRHISEKWEVGEICLKLLSKFLIQYDPQSSYFPVPNQEFNPPPGFHLMTRLNTKSEFLKLILHILDESAGLFDTYSEFPGKTPLIECTYHCLSMLNRTLILQEKFSELLASSSWPALITSLNRLLMDMNPRSNRPDYLLKICKFISYQSFVPKHSFVAMQILKSVTRHPTSHSQLMNLLMSYTDIDTEFRHSFVECLDADDDWEDDGTEDNDIVTLTKETLLKLLKQCLNHNAPNLTHFLLGFDLKQDISKTVFQFPGVLNFPKTVLHSLFSILSNNVGNRFIAMKPSFIESAYHLLYLLCADPKTSGPVLRYIRLNQDFFTKNILFLSKPNKISTSDLNQISWLLKTVAIELKVCSDSNQLFYLKHLTKLLVGYPEIIERDNEDSVQMIEEIRIAEGKNLMISLIKNHNFNIDQVETPQWDYFDNNLMQNLISSCETKRNPSLINIKKLHQVLIDELSTLQGTAAVSQRQMIFSEVQEVLKYAIRMNNIRNQAFALVRFMDSWRQVIEVLVICVPLDVISIADQQVLIVQTLETLLYALVHRETLSEISTFASGAVLVMLESLYRNNLVAHRRKQVVSDDSELTLIQDVTHAHTSSLKIILRHILEWIKISGIATQKLRINLYGALISFLQLISQGTSNANAKVENSFYVSRLDSSASRVSDTGSIDPINFLSVVNEFGEQLIEVICHDCLNGHDICQMLAMSSFNMLLYLSAPTQWILYLSGNGYLKHLIDSILKSDNTLISVLEPSSNNLRPLYLYENKMALLNRIGTSRIGAQLLLEQRMLASLASMRVYDFHPEIKRNNMNILDDVHPTIEERYQAMFFPTLQLCDTLITSLGSDNQSVIVQIIFFLFSHTETVEMILRAGNSSLPASFLRELALLTNVIARTANNELPVNLDTNASPYDNSAHLHRLQKLMLALLPRFVLSENVIRELISDTSQDKPVKSEKLVNSFQILSNLVLYARNVIANHGIDHTSVKVLFQPTLTDTLTNFTRQQFTHLNEQSPTLGVIVQHLIQCVQYYHKEKINLDLLDTRIKSLPNMNSLDLKDIVDSDFGKYNIIVIREDAYKKLSEVLKIKKKEIEYCTFIIENCLYLIWAHLDYYMLKAIPRTRNFEFNKSSTTTLASASEATWKVSTDDISNLKHSLVSIFNDSFSRQLVETTQDRSETDKGFIEALLRRIKRLIQFVPVK